MELFQASHQWAIRPADQRFWSLEELHTATHHYAMQARTATDVPYATLRTQANAGEVMLVGKKDVPAKLTHWAFGQLAARVGAPAGYLRSLPARGKDQGGAEHPDRGDERRRTRHIIREADQ